MMKLCHEIMSWNYVYFYFLFHVELNNEDFKSSFCPTIIMIIAIICKNYEIMNYELWIMNYEFINYELWNYIPNMYVILVYEILLKVVSP